MNTQGKTLNKPTANQGSSKSTSLKKQVTTCNLLIKHSEEKSGETPLKESARTKCFCR